MNLLSGNKEFLDAGPIVADDGNTARGRLEQPNAWRISCRRHVPPRQIEGVAQAAVEPRMRGRRQVFDMLYIRRPSIGRRVLRAGNDEFVFRKPAGRFYHQSLEQRLPILAVGAEISERP